VPKRLRVGWFTFLFSLLIFILSLALAATAQTAQTNLAVTVRHAPNLNGNGRIERSLQQLLGESVTLNGGFTMTGDLLVPGTPTLRVNGKPAFAGTIAGNGSTSPTGYQITLNGNCSLNYLRTRINPVTLPTVTAPPQPAGTRNVTINSAGQSIGDPATLRNLTLNGNVGQVTVPPGTYGNFTANGGSGLVLGVAGGLQAGNYNLQNLNLNGSSKVKVVGPVVLTVANGFTANGSVGASNNPAWLQIRVASGGLTLNGGCTVHGLVVAPNGTVIVNGNSMLVGTSASDQFILNGGGVVRWAGSSPQTIQPPVATNQTITLAENSSINITLTGYDPQELALTFSVLTQPAHGTLSGTPPGMTYRPAANYFGGDAFTFKVNNGVTDSAPATISLIITQVYYPPVAYSRLLTNFEDTALPVTLTGSDPQGYALTYRVLTPPAHGTLRGTAPNLTYLPATNYFGNDAFTFQVSDGVSNSAPATITITNQPVDDPPQVVAGPNQLIILPVNTASLAGSIVFDAFPGMVDTVLWSQVSGPGSVTFSNPSNPMTLATFNTNGIYRLRLLASDSFLSSSDDLFVTVDAPPAVNASPALTNTFPETVQLFGSASDDGLPINGTLTVLWRQVSGPGTVVFGNPAATNTTATFSTNGIYVLRLTADDSIATNHSDITIIENLPPVVNAGPAQTVNFGTTVTLAGTVTDDQLPHNILNSTWTEASGPGTVVFGNAAATNSSAIFSTNGIYVLRLTADDSIATNHSDITIIENQPPTVVITSPATQTEYIIGQSIDVNVTASDADGHVVLVRILVDGIPLAELAVPPFTAVWTNAASGDHVITATATDDVGATSASSKVLISVLEPERGDFSVEAGADQIISLPNSASLVGTVVIQTPVSGAKTNVTWSKLDGPGDVQFSEPNALITIAQFGEPGSYTLKLRVTYAEGTRSDTLTVDVLPAPPNRLTAARSNRGTDFWLTFLYNEPGLYDPPYAGCDLYISADADTVADVSEGGYDIGRFQVRGGASTRVKIDPGDLTVSDAIQANAIHVTADHPVTVHGLNYYTYTTDGYLALPTAMLGTDYIVLAYQNSPSWYDPEHIVGGTEFAVVATEDATSVTITPSATTDSRVAGVPYEIILQQGETYRLMNFDDSDADFTGTTIQSDKPVAVFGGHACALIPPSTPAADHLVEQLPPVNTWGRHFVTMPLATRANGDTFRFLAATNGTRVAINGKIVASLDRGQFYEQIIDGPAEILASKPILVAQYANGSDFDGTTGDPFMMLIPPFEQFGGDYILSTAMATYSFEDPPRLVYTNNYINLTVRTNGAGTILLDDVPVPAGCFQLIGNSGYAGAQIPINPGVHHLSAPVPFGACVYGWAFYESYAFMGGFYSETVESDTSLEMTQPTPFAAVGHEKTVTARVTNGRGFPLPDVEVSFSVSGANAAAGRAITSRFGDASFSYTGANTGADVITATLVDLKQTVTNTWLASSDNAPPTVSTADTQPVQFSLTAQLSGTVSDDGRPAGANLNVHWFFLGGPGDVQFEDATQPSTRAFCSEPGTYQFELIANDSQFSSRAVVNVTVVRPFTVELSGVEPGTWFSTNASVSLSANIDILDGAYTNVEFFDGAVKLSEGMSTSLVMDSPSPGEHAITVVVTEEHGFQVRSEPLEFFVTLPPQIEVTLPDEDLTLPYENPAATFKARAWDPDGTIASFAVYVGPVLVYQTNGDQIDFTGSVHSGVGVWSYGTQPVHFVATDDHGISTEIYTANAIHVTADHPVTVHGLNYFTYTTDSYG